MKSIKKIGIIFALVMMIFALAVPVYAASDDAAAPASDAVVVTEENADGGIGFKAVASAIAIGLGAAGGAIGMGLAAGKAVESISRQPEAESKIRTTLMLGLVFIETAIIYALLVVILIIFVL